jgi:hypothetical protein
MVAPNDTITVEPAPEGRWLVHVGGKDLLFTREHDPRVRDIDLAVWLGFARPRNIRRLIKKMIDAGKLSDVHVRSVTERTSMPQGGAREVVVTEYWLTQVEAALVATQSGTRRGWELTRQMAEVFKRVSRGEHPALDEATQRRLYEDALARHLQTFDSRRDAIEKRVSDLADAGVKIFGEQARAYLVGKMRQAILTLMGVGGMPLGAIDGTDLWRVLGAFALFREIFEEIQREFQPAPMRSKRLSAKRQKKLDAIARQVNLFSLEMLGSMPMLVAPPPGHRLVITSEKTEAAQ